MHRLATLPVLIAALAPLPAQNPATAPAGPHVIEAVLPAPPSRVWKVLSTAEGWKALGVAKAEMDFRVLGKIRTHYSPAGRIGDDGTIENTILAYDPERMLAIKATKTPKEFPFPAEIVEPTWSVMFLEDMGDGRTLLSVRGHGYTSHPQSIKMREHFEQGNRWTLQQLAKHLGAGGEPSGPDAPIEIAERVRATPGEVFESLTTSEGYKSFLGVRGNVRLEPGGPIELHFAPDAPEGQRGSEGCTFLSWLPGRMIAFTWNAPPSMPRARAQRTLVVIELEGDGPDATRVRLTHSGFREKIAAEPAHAEEWRKVRAYFAKTWPNVLGKLKARYE